MSYTKNDPQPSGLNAGETAVTLDDGTIVAIKSVSSRDPDTNVMRVGVTARAIDANGSPIVAPDGSPIAVDYRNGPVDPADIERAGSIDAYVKCCLMRVLGESTDPLWQDPLDANVNAQVSIRHALALATAVTSVDAGALL